MYNKKVAVVGVGNTLMGDEGIGILVLNELEKKTYSGDIEFIDAGTGFFNIVSELRSFGKVIIIDAVHGGQEAGTVYRFEIDDIEGKGDSAVSLHDFGVLESIQLERIVAKLPEDIVFYGIEPQNIELLMEISPVVKRKVNYVVQKIIDELRESGIEVVG